MTDEPLDHILRTPLPWRDDSLTECGRAENDVKSTITLNQYRIRRDRDGQRRTAFTVCQTCEARVDLRFLDTWEHNPIGLMWRECHRVGPHAGQYRRGAESAAHLRLANELHAIAALIAEHRDEFDGYLAGLDDVTSLDSKRRDPQKMIGRQGPRPL